MSNLALGVLIVIGNVGVVVCIGGISDVNVNVSVSVSHCNSLSISLCLSVQKCILSFVYEADKSLNSL